MKWLDRHVHQISREYSRNAIRLTLIGIAFLFFIGVRMILRYSGESDEVGLAAGIFAVAVSSFNLYLYFRVLRAIPSGPRDATRPLGL